MQRPRDSPSQKVGGKGISRAPSEVDPVELAKKNPHSNGFHMFSAVCLYKRNAESQRSLEIVAVFMVPSPFFTSKSLNF